MSEILKVKVFVKKESKIYSVSNINLSSNEISYYDDNKNLVVVSSNDVKLLFGTPFKDVSGKDIYEGDILKRVDDDSKERYIVCKNDYSNNIFFKREETGTLFNLELFFGKDYEIVDNIFTK